MNDIYLFQHNLFLSIHCDRMDRNVILGLHLPLFVFYISQNFNPKDKSNCVSKIGPYYF